MIQLNPRFEVIFDLINSDLKAAASQYSYYNVSIKY